MDARGRRAELEIGCSKTTSQSRGGQISGYHRDSAYTSLLQWLRSLYKRRSEDQPTDAFLLAALQVDVEKCTYHGEAGMKLSALHPKLREHGLAVSSLGSISDQTLAGCLSTATHGSGVTFGNLSSCVTFLDLVLPLPDAPVVRVSREQDSDLFLSALCGLGSVGVIVGVGSRCEKDFKLEEEVWTIGFAEFVERWQEIAESAEHVRCWWFPQVGQVKVSRMNRTTKVRAVRLSCEFKLIILMT